MLKKTITFKNFNGETEVDDFYFHLTEADLARMELGKGGMEEYINRIVKAQNGEEIIAMFEMFIKSSYGVKSVDGRKFIKNPQNLEEFTSSGAYDVMFLELVTDAEKGSEFVNGIMPAELLAKGKAQAAMQASPGISQNLAAHLDVQDVPFNVPATLAVVPEPQLTAEQFQGQESVVGPIFDEMSGPTPAERKVQELLAKNPRQMDKGELLVAMKLKNAKGQVLSQAEVTGMNPETLELMLAAGATIEGF